MRTRSGGAAPRQDDPAVPRPPSPDPGPPGGGGLTGDVFTLTTLYEMHYRSLVRLAALLVSDLATAEDIVQDVLRRGAGHAAHAARRRRRAVLPAPVCGPSFPVGAARPARAGCRPKASRGSAVVSALWALPVRQREVLVLLYFVELTEAEVASATGISMAAVRSHAARAMSSLRAELRPAGE